MHSANLHPGCIFGLVNGVLRICNRCKFAPTFEVEQICIRVQIVHMNAKCVFSIRFDRRF